MRDLKIISLFLISTSKIDNWDVQFLLSKCVLKKIKFFYFKLIFFNIFISFWYVDVKNNF
jgi:hypothetical protein